MSTYAAHQYTDNRRGGGGGGGHWRGGRGGNNYSRGRGRGRGGNNRDRRGGNTGYDRSGGSQYSNRNSYGGGSHDNYGGGGSHYHGGNRGNHHNYGDAGGGGYHRGGRSGKGGRGGRGGRGRGGRGRGGHSTKSMVRFHDTSCEPLNREVMTLNKDHPGPQQIRVLKFNSSHWEAVESLTKGNFYYHNRFEKKPPMKKIPSELKDRQIVKTEYRPYTVSYANRPKEWPESNMDTIMLKTNSFQVRGKILETEVHQFEVTFDPPIKSENVTLREGVVLGSSLRQKRKNYELLRKQLGEFQFDNHALYSMGTDRPKGPVTFEELHPDYKVVFHCIDSFRLSDPNIPIQQQEALLNIFNRKRLQKSGFSRIGRGWFKKGAASRENAQEISVHSNSAQCPDVNIINGFECSMRILPQNDPKSHRSSDSHSVLSGSLKQLTVFKADLSHKLVEKLTLHKKLALMSRGCASLEEFHARAERELKRRHFLLSYNKRNLQIHDIDWSQTETSVFELQSGGKISYKEYLERHYNVRSPEKELCVIKDKGGAAFLPQHIRLTITSKQSDAIYDAVLNFVNPPTEERLNRIEDFVQHINQTSEEDRGTDEKLDIDFEIEEESMTTPAMVLQMPQIIIQGENGPMDPRPVDDFKYHLTRGFLGKVKQLQRWAVIYEAHPRDPMRNCQKSYESFVRSWDEYVHKRHFNPRNGPIAMPQGRPIEDLLDEKSYSKAVREGDQLLVLILPEGIRGSEAKAKFTKCVQQANFRVPCLVQCIQNQTCTKRNACLGTFEDIMIKFGNVPYKIDPMLRCGNSHIDIDSAWVIGVDVSHVSNKPSVVMLSLAREPFEGSLRSMHFLAHLNPSRKEIVAFPNMVTLMYGALQEAYQATLADQGKKLPKSIWVFRDGVADGQIQELYTKEVVGMQRALTMFRENTKLKKWRPSLQYILCNKNTIDRFGLLDKRTGLVRPLNKPCVIYDHVLSDRLWDFIIFPYHHRKPADRTKGVRYIVLQDQLKLAEKKLAPLDLFQFIFGLTYMFAFSVPFPLGGTAQPAPIVYAKHYAESTSQSILSSDTSLRDLQVDPKLNRPHVVTGVIIDKPTQ